MTNLSSDSNEFLCNDCGEDFEADNGIDVEEDEAGFIDLDPDTALFIANSIKKDDDNAQSQ
ncbi:hypothetical protein D3C85_1834150 [compost metagenome]